MKKTFARLLCLCITGIVGSASQMALAAIPNPRADYQFNENLKSSVNSPDVPRLRRVEDPEQYGFGSSRIHGRDRYFLKFASGAGLRLPTAKEAVGSGDDYTIAMLLRLNDISEYRKLVDFDNLTADKGWYEESGFLHPYDVQGIEAPDPLPISEDKWHFIVMTRDEGIVKGYVDGKRYFSLDDQGQEVLGSDEVLHFLMDDDSADVGDEESAGKIARLMIWKNPLTNYQATHVNY